ncbi:unnamed protein product [Boreogadus saida]
MATATYVVYVIEVVNEVFQPLFLRSVGSGLGLGDAVDNALSFSAFAAKYLATAALIWAGVSVSGLASIRRGCTSSEAMMSGKARLLGLGVGTPATPGRGTLRPGHRDLGHRDHSRVSRNSP